jgi:hypothetical protein
MTERVSRASGQLIQSMMATMKSEDEDVFEDGEDAGGEHLVERVDVGGDAGDEAADGVAVEEGDDMRWRWRKIWLRMSNMIFWPVHCMR